MPIPGVNIAVEGDTKSTSTDFDGTYTLNDVTSTNKLIFSFIGLISQTKEVGNQTTINVKLQEPSQNLKEVVVVAYGAQKRVLVTGAISTVTAKDIAAIPVTNAESALQGRAAGVTVVNNGPPGSTPQSGCE